MTKLTWTDAERFMDELAEKVRVSGFTPDVAVGVMMGGLFPLYYVTKRLKIPEALAIGARSYEKDVQKQINIGPLPEADLADKRVLLIDEIIDTGKTFEAIRNAIQSRYHPSVIKTATIAVNIKNTTSMPDFHVLESNEWVVFPWEKIEFPEFF